MLSEEREELLYEVICEDQGTYNEKLHQSDLVELIDFDSWFPIAPCVIGWELESGRLNYFNEHSTDMICIFLSVGSIESVPVIIELLTVND
jgi:hypothetical protein